MSNLTKPISPSFKPAIESKVKCANHTPLKLFQTLSIAVCLAFLSGCMSYSTLQRAKGEWNVVSGKQTENPQPINYALLPFAAAADVITLPVQGAIYLMLSQGP